MTRIYLLLTKRLICWNRRTFTSVRFQLIGNIGVCKVVCLVRLARVFNNIKNDSLTCF